MRPGTELFVFREMVAKFKTMWYDENSYTHSIAAVCWKGWSEMENFNFHSYTNFIFGKDTQSQVGAEVKKRAGKVLLHYGGGSIKKYGLYDQITSSLRECGVEFVELGGVQPNPRLTLVHQGIALCRKEKVDFILAVGGGSVIDSAKAIAVGCNYMGEVWDLFEGKEIRHKVLPVGVVLTIPAAGSESSPNMVITKEDGLLKKGLRCEDARPQFAILNPELTYSLPFYQTACGVSDMLAHTMERYFSNSTGVDVSDRMCEGVMRSILHTAPYLKEHPNDYNARANIMWAGTVAHNGILGCGRIEDWGSHGIEHEISAIYDIAHGAGLSIIFPAWMKYVYNQNITRFLQFAVRVMDVDMEYYNPETIILEGIRRLEAFYQRIELPIRLSEIGIDSSRFEEMARKAAPRGNLKVLHQEDIVNIYKLAL